MTDSSSSEPDELESELEQSSFYHDSRGHLFVFIETLTGTSFEMRVSPFETIVSIKAKLQQLEGIPVIQQHLLFNSKELPNKLSLYECGVQDGATLKLVLGMRGGPINTRKVILPDESTKELEEAVERNKEELLEQIPEGGHVTVLVFRDGDNINLYHVLERPDGSYSPLSDSWSGTSIRNLFAEQDDPEVEQRIRENANTMSKMHALRSQLEQTEMRRQTTLPQESPRRAAVSRTPDQLPQDIGGSRQNLPPIRRRRSLERDWERGVEEWSRESRVPRIRDPTQRLPKVKVDQQRTIDFGSSSPTPPPSNRSHNNNTDLSKFHSTRPRAEVGSRPGSHRRRPSKLISLDVSELKRTLDDNEGFAPARRASHRRDRKLSGQARLSESKNAESDIFHRPGHLPSPRENKLESDMNENELSFDIFHRPSPRSPARALPPFLTSSNKPSAPNRPGDPSLEKNEHIFNLNLSESLGDRAHQSASPIPQSSSVQKPSIREPLKPSSPGRRGLERRLIHSKRGKLGRRENGAGSPSRVPTVLASPKGHSRERTSPRTSPRLMRPSFPTRPLSGPKRKKNPKPRCAESECRKKINITNSYSCRCEMVFCAKHRHPEAHACTYDYKTEGRKLLKASNPMITVPKLPKI